MNHEKKTKYPSLSSEHDQQHVPIPHAARTLRILYVGQLWDGSTCKQRMMALKELGHAVTSIDVTPEWVQTKQQRFIYRLRRRFIGPGDLAGVNQWITRHFEKEEFDVLWLDKAITINQRTVLGIRRLCDRCVIIGYSPDDMICNRLNRVRRFSQLLPLYNIMFTTNLHNVVEFREAGCGRVEYVHKGFDPSSHRPVAVDEPTRRELGGRVGFVGSYEHERSISMLRLAETGIPVRIWGEGWHRCAIRHPNLRIEGQPVWADRYAETICSFDINLSFLRRANRDVQNSRGIEIPACGSFMLAERSQAHQALFKEGNEAEFFNSDEELIEKTGFYMDHPRQRQSIAAAGRKRCLESGYSHHDRVRWMLNTALSVCDQQCDANTERVC